MSLEDAVRTLLAKLENSKREYLLVGAFAVWVWGIARSTDDADFVVTMSGVELDRLLRELPPEFSVEEQAKMELFTGTMRWVLRVAASLFSIEIFLRGQDPHHLEMFARKRRQFIPQIEREAWIPSAEDLIIQKLRWARSKDLDDARGILAVQGSAIDFPYLESWCVRHGTSERMTELRRNSITGI